MKKAIIVGSKGQDGTYLSELLLSKGYEVIGISKQGLYSGIVDLGKPFDIKNDKEVDQLILQHKPQEVYFLAAVHHSSEEALADEREIFRKSFEINTLALINFLEAIRKHSPLTRLFYAASCHVFGSCTQEIQDEKTFLNPNCIYGITKTAGVQICRYYRDNHSVCVHVGILYNHESPRRSSRFISRKIVEAAIAIKNKQKDSFTLGSLDSQIDWGYAPDYVDAMHKILQLPQGEDFIISSGTQHTVKDFVQGVFSELGLDWRKYVQENPTLIQKKRKGNLQGNNQKLRQMTGWSPRVSFEELIKIMVKERVEAGVS